MLMVLSFGANARYEQMPGQVGAKGVKGSQAMAVAALDDAHVFGPRPRVSICLASASTPASSN
jgi:hypothetical protein